MARKEYDGEDPLSIVGVLMDEPPNDEAVAEMGRCFIEEMARIGWKRDAILAAFRSPVYRGPYLVYERLGEAFVVGTLGSLEQRGTGR